MASAKTRVISVQPDGTANIRSPVPGRIWTLIGRVAQAMGVTELQAWRIMLLRLDLLIDKTNGDVLGLEYRQAYEGLLSEDAVPHDGLPEINLSKLHRSAKTRSGFVGVYANGKGFRAMAKMPGDDGHVQKSIGTFQTAERAAWARYIHYKKYGLPYGVLEDRIAEVKLKQSDFAKNFTDDQLKHWLIWSQKHDVGSPFENLEPEDRALEDVDFWGSLSPQRAIELSSKITRPTTGRTRRPISEEDEPPIDGIPSFTEPDDSYCNENEES